MKVYQPRVGITRTTGLNRRISDDELRAAQLRIGDPRYQEGLVVVLPAGQELVLVRLANTYQWPHEKIGCVSCGAKKHNKGFTAELADGSLVLVGSKCGAKTFGSWEKAARGLKDTKRRQDYLLESDQWRHRVDEIVAALRSWSQQLVYMDASRRRFRMAMPDLHELLCRSATYDGGRLKLYEVVRSQGLGAGTGKRSGTVEERISTFGGAEYFTGGAGAATLDAVMRQLVGLAAEYDGTDTKTNDQLRQLSTKKRSATTMLEKLLARHVAWAKFFEPDNLVTVAYWATTSDDLKGSYRAEGGSLLNQNDVVMKLHTEYAALDKSVLLLL